MQITEFRIEYQKSPQDLSVACPRFSWKMESDEKNTMQSMYHMVIKKEQDVVWDSGEVASDHSIQVEYQGQPLREETEYSLCLTIQDNYGKRSQWQDGFRTGLFSGSSLSGQMITHDFEPEETSCPVFYQNFSVKKQVAKAYAYATAQGVYDLFVNGKKAGDIHMAPGWTSYHKHLMFQTYDITELLQEENTVELLVGNGWFKGVLGFDVRPNRYGDRVAALGEIHVFYADGTKDVICTDTSWKVRLSEITASEIYYGESVDTTGVKEKLGTVSVVDFDKSILSPQENEPVRITQRLEPVEIFTDPAGNQLVDFGQNLTGVVELSIQGEKGQVVTISHAEVLDKDGVFYPETLRLAKSIDTYILNGEQQVLHPHFTFHGFRYAKVEGIQELSPSMFTALVIHSDMEQLGDFTCSNEKVSRLQKNIAWGHRDNFLDVPTDCPQRDERLGWMGDAQIFSWTAAFNRNCARFFTKWMHDVALDSSLEKGVPHVVPDILNSYSAAAWSDAAVIIPWVVYQTYGDTRILEENWTCMHQWVDYIKNNCDENGLWMSGFQYGDWLALDKEESADRTGATDRYMIANAYYLYVTDLVQKIAGILHKEKEQTYYKNLYKKTLEIFQAEYYTSAGRIVSETQTGAVISLYFDLAREKDRERILNTLLVNIYNHKNHLATGFVGTPYLCHVLSENGAHDMAATLFMREDYPSWLYAVNKGATTIWERWNSIMPDGSFDVSGMNSLNHYAYGSIGDWMYRKIGGISQLEPGYKKFLVAPKLVQGIEESYTCFDSMYGKIESQVRCMDGEIYVKIVVPANTTAEILLPEQDQVQKVGSGTYEFTYETTTSLKVERFSMESTLGEIVAEPLAVEMFEQFAPGMLDSPMIQYAFQMSLTELLGAAPEAKPMYEAVVAALNAQEQK